VPERPHFVITASGRVAAVPSGDDNIDTFLEYLVDEVGTRAPVVAMTRAQVLARIARSALPTGFPEADVVIGDADREGGFTRGWMEGTVAAWEAAKLDSAAVADSASADSEAAPSAGAADAGAPGWLPKSRVWTDLPMAADQWIVLATSRGIVSPSGVVLAGPLPAGEALWQFIAWRWKTGHTKEMPQIWLTPEALAGVGLTEEATADLEPEDFTAAVAETFGCEVTRAKSGWYTARFATDTGAKRSVYLVVIDQMWTDQPEQRPGDMGLAGWEGTDTELPDDEVAAVKVLADRMTWLAGLGDSGVVPAGSWATVGAQILNRLRAKTRAKDIAPAPLPPLVSIGGDELEPAVTSVWERWPHRSKDGQFIVKVDQRAAYLAAAGQVELGYGTPKELTRISRKTFEDPKPPFGLWRLNLAPADQFDLSKRLPLPHPAMAWDAPSTFWATTRGVQHLLATTENGGAGLGVDELGIDAAYVWPQQGRLLRTWADALRVALIDARAAGRTDHEEMVKSIYKAYLGRMSTAKWSQGDRQHEQPAWAAAIRADTRARAFRYAARIVQDHNLFPVQAELDTWVYLVPDGTDISFLDEPSDANGKYRVKEVIPGPNGEGPAPSGLP
jgi:hypothetical protein